MKIINKDILDVWNSKTPSIVVHQVNCKGVMGAGLAKQIKDKYPFVFDCYLEDCEKYQYWVDLLGEAQYVNLKYENTTPAFWNDYNYIVNLFAQYDYGNKGRYTEYSAFYEGLYTIAKDITECLYSVPNVYLPYKIGCGLGGGDWNVITDIIETVEKQFKIEFKICKLDD